MGVASQSLVRIFTAHWNAPFAPANPRRPRSLDQPQPLPRERKPNEFRKPFANRATLGKEDKKKIPDFTKDTKGLNGGGRMNRTRNQIVHQAHNAGIAGEIPRVHSLR